MVAGRGSALPLPGLATPLRPARPRLRRGAPPHRLRRVRDARGRVRQPDHVPAIRAARPLRPQLLLDHARLHERGARLRDAPGARPEDGRPAADRDPHRDRHAGLQRGDLPDLRGRRGHQGLRRGDGAGGGLRLLHPLRFDRPRCLDRRGARLPGAPGEARAGRPPLLSPPREEPPSQGRQHRRFHHALGRRLRGDDRARRGQPHDGGVHRVACRRHGGGSTGRHHPVVASDPQPQHPVRPSPAIRRPRDRTGHRDGSRRMVGPGRQLLGPQRHHPDPRLRGPLRVAGPARQAALRRPRAQPRFR